MVCKYFLPVCMLPFHLVDCIFCHVAFWFDVIPFVFLLLFLEPLVSYPKIHCQDQVKVLFPCFYFSSSFMVLGLTFRPNLFRVSFCECVRWGFIFIFLHVNDQFSQIQFIEETILSPLSIFDSVVKY